MSYILRLGQIQKKIEQIQDTLSGGGGGSGSGVNAEVQAAINALQSDLEDLEDQYSSLSNTITTFDNDIDTLQTLHTNLNNEVTTIGNELDTLRSSHIILSSKTNTIESNLDTLEASHITLQSAYTTVNNKANTAQAEVDSLETQVGALDTQLNNLEIEVDNLIASINSSGINWADITPATIPTTFNPVTHASRHIPGGTDIIPDATITISGLMSNVDKTKLNGIANSATLNSTDTFLLNRTNHTGTQAISTITSLQTTLDGKENTITNLPVTKGGTGNISIAIDNIFYASATNTLTPTPITSYVRTLLDDIDATTFRTTLGLGSIALQDAGSVAITGGTATFSQATISTTRTNSIQRVSAGTMSVASTNTTTLLELGNVCTTINVGTGDVPKTINIGGNAGDILNITGSVVSQNVTNSTIQDKLITFNKGGAAASSEGSGFEIEEAATITSYFKIGNTRNSFDLKTSARNGILRFTPSSSAFTHEIITSNTANRTFTLPDVDINLNSQAQNLVYASPVSSTGAMNIRALVGADIPLASSTVRGAISKEATANFTPVLEGSTTAGTQTYASRSGFYHLVGNVCTISILISLSAKDAAMAGNVQISGLPFTSNAAFRSAVSFADYSGITLSTNYFHLGGRVELNSNLIFLFQNGSGQNTINLGVSNIASNFFIMCTVSYFIA